jgi:hypothetical protein
MTRKRECHSEPDITPLCHSEPAKQARNLLRYEWQIRRRFLTSFGMTGRGTIKKEISRYARNDKKGARNDKKGSVIPRIEGEHIGSPILLLFCASALLL